MYARKMPQESEKLKNTSDVYKALQSIGSPATISEIHNQLVGKSITERTVRRAIESLTKSGHVIDAGKRGLSIQYALRNHLPDGEVKNRLIPFGSGRKMPADEFIDLMVNPGSNPLNKFTKKPLLSDEMSEAIRQRMTFVILSSGEPGYKEAIMTYRNGLMKIQEELQYVQGILSEFIASPVWYDHCRDVIAMNVREMQKENPELFKLARDYILNLGVNTEEKK